MRCLHGCELAIATAVSSMTAGEAGSDTVAYQRYVRVRDWARRIKAVGPGETTAAEDAAAAALESLWNATPAMVADLRHLAEPLGSSAADDYRDSESADAKTIRRDLKRLFVQVGQDLLVPEPAVLGGFGCRTIAGPANADTVRFFGALVALDDGAVLSGFRQTSRRVVWEIGGGWGGFAYQFKTICPNVTYIITGSAESLLLSALYLTTAFPGARASFFETSHDDRFERDWEDVDFVFAPETALNRLRFPRLDLTVDLQALAQLTPQRVERHVQHASDAGCRYFFSLHHGDWTAGEIPAWRAIEARYWLHPVPPRIQHRKGHAEYSHAIGWRRLQA
jgi:hypothetical protein